MVTLDCITKAGSFMTCDGNITLDCITKAGSFMTCDGNKSEPPTQGTRYPAKKDTLRQINTATVIFRLCRCAHARHELLMRYQKEDKMEASTDPKMKKFIQLSTCTLVSGRPIKQLRLSHSNTAVTLTDSQRVSFMLRQAYIRTPRTGRRFRVK